MVTLLLQNTLEGELSKVQGELLGGAYKVTLFTLLQQRIMWLT